MKISFFFRIIPIIQFLLIKVEYNYLLAAFFYELYQYYINKFSKTIFIALFN